ncbi:MAG: hypothetical protein J6Z01_15855 [Bacteroidales bacterium]|nr:hypothetical protein [Bacteroidales bacterium]
MTAVELRSELFYEISPLLDDESLMMKVINFVKGLKSTKQDSVTVKQQQLVKESLTRAFDELKQAQRGEKQLKTADEFIKELGL